MTILSEKVMLSDKADKIKELKAEIKKETTTVNELTEEMIEAAADRSGRIF